MPPVTDDSGMLEGSRYVREDSAPPIGIDANVRRESLFLAPHLILEDRRSCFCHAPHVP